MMACNFALFANNKPPASRSSASYFIFFSREQKEMRNEVVQDHIDNASRIIRIRAR